MNGKKIIIGLGVLSFATGGLLHAGARYIDSLSVAHKAKVGSSLTVNGGADINGAVNIPQGPFNVMNNKLKVDSSGVNVSGTLKVNGQSVGGATGSFPAPFEVKSGSTSLFRVDTNSSVNIGRSSGSAVGTVAIGNNASQVQVGNNCPTVNIGKTGGQVNLNGTVKVNGSTLGSGGSSGTVKGTFEVKNSGGSSTFFRVDGSSGDAQAFQDLTISGKTTCNGDLQLKGQLLDDHGDPIDFGGGASGEIVGPIVMKNEAGDPYFESNPYDKNPEGLCGDILVSGNMKILGSLVDKDDNPIGGGAGGGGANDVTGNFTVAYEGAEIPTFAVNTDAGMVNVNGILAIKGDGGEIPVFAVDPAENKVVVTGELVDGEGNSLLGEGDKGGPSGSAFGQMADVTFVKDAETYLLSIIPVEGGADPMLVELAYHSGTDSFNLCIALTNGEEKTATVIGGFAKIGGSVVSDVTTAFTASYDGSVVGLTLTAGDPDYSTGGGVLFFRVFGNSLSDATAYVM